MANIDSKIMDELEEKKWLISRIDLYHKTMIDIFKNELQKIENQGDKTISRYRGRRNNTLSGLGVILTILLGIIAVYKIEQTIFFVILAILGIIGLITIIIFNYSIRKHEEAFLMISEIYNEIIGISAGSLGFIMTSGARLSQVTLDFAFNYHIFTLLLNNALMVYNLKSRKKLSEKYDRFPELKAYLTNEYTNDSDHFQSVPLLYSRFNRSLPVPPKVLEFIDNMLNEYKTQENTDPKFRQPM